MSYDIYKKAKYKDLEVAFKVPSIGTKIDLYFGGEYLFEIINENGIMRPTGNAVDGWGNPVVFEQDDILFEEIQKEEYQKIVGTL